MPDYRITQNQREYLETLVCQRLSDDDANKELVKYFENVKNPNIAASLRSGWNTDKKDKLAYYIVKDPKMNVPLFI